MPQVINWTPAAGPIGPLAGMALYGLETPRNVTLSNFQCDSVWSACVFLNSTPVLNSTTGPSAVSNVIQKCAGFANVWPTYYGVELAAGAEGVAVSNVSEIPSCGIPNAQFVHFDNPVVDASVQTLSQSPSAQFCLPSLGFKSHRYYTTPYITASGTAVTADILYAIPIQIACTVTVTQLSTYVTTGAASSSCEYGIYGNNGGGQPGALILDAGSAATTTSNAIAPSGALSTQVSPGIVFLVVGCNGTPSLRSSSTTGSLMGNLIGWGAPNDVSTMLESMPLVWNHTLPLPSVFPGIAYSSSTPAPLVYLTP